jgi:hypothetical protein
MKTWFVPPIVIPAALFIALVVMAAMKWGASA